ncbi:hypothetical protein CRG98_007871 [Punica granatum]|uniref:Uncharacterized protein n=1 Tax=Punica granatum TaxID=22663 RepID=A0A2I0KTD8_PUNGR|nr:hypothetical protein CRG98_007871 [Punica granatum]
MEGLEGYQASSSVMNCIHESSLSSSSMQEDDAIWTSGEAVINSYSFRSPCCGLSAIINDDTLHCPCCSSISEHIPFFLNTRHNAYESCTGTRPKAIPS